MFQRIMNWIREVLNKMLNLSSVKQATRLDVAITPLMADALQKWSAIYTNQSPWLNADVQSLNLGAAIASEVARAVTIEMDVQIAGSPRADYLAQQFAPVLNALRLHTEYGCAKGGMWFKPYIKGDALAVDYVQADMGYPIAFDANGNMTACVFADQKTIGQTYYTRLEYHALTANGYMITNTAWRSSARDTLGSQVPLASVPEWADLQPEATILNIDKPLFAYFKMPLANSIDPTSPLGVSIYARAADGTKCLIQQADEQWSNFLWEFESGKRALYTTPDGLAKDATTGKPILPDKRLFRLLDLAAVQIDKPGFFEEWTPTLREVNLLNGLDAILRKIEFNCGLSYGVISNPESVALTATEIKGSKQRYYMTVTDTQKALEDALDGLLYAMDVWTTLANLAPKGTYTATYTWDDSIVADHDTQFSQDLQVLDRVMSKVEFRMRNYGEDEATARKMVEMVNAERQPVDFFPATE